MVVKLLNEHHLEFLILKECYRGSSESKMSKCQIVGNLMPWLNFLCAPSTINQVMFRKCTNRAQSRFLLDGRQE